MIAELFGVALTVVLVAVVWVVARRGLLAPPSPASPASPAALPEEPWDEAAELRRLVEGSAEVQALFGRLGFQPEVERAALALLAELKGLIRTEIPDFAAFSAALDEIEAQQAAPAPADMAGESPRPRLQPDNAELLRTVLAVRADRVAVLAVLDRAPVEEALPFVEQIPLLRGGEVTWRTPVELALLRKRPADPARFERLLDELERLVRGARLARREKARAELTEAIARVRRDARRDGAYMPTSLQALEPALRDWLLRAEAPATLRKREQLEELLAGLLRVRRGLARPGAGSGLAETARAQAQLYAASPWMHTPELTGQVLTNLLDAELALLLPSPAMPAGPGAPAAPAAVLRRVRGEVASGHYDGEETARRLRQQEEHGIYVHSLVYALLRVSRLPSDATP